MDASFDYNLNFKFKSNLKSKLKFECGIAAPLPAPPPPPPAHRDVGSLRNFPGGLMFGISHNLDIEGPRVCGRYIRAKKLLQSSGRHTPLPHVFSEGGGHRPAVGGKGKGKKGKVWDWRDKRVHYVMGLVQRHEGEYRRWHPNWGPRPANTRIGR